METLFRLFTVAYGGRLRNKVQELKQERLRLESKKKCITKMTAKQQSREDQRVCVVSVFASFKLTGQKHEN